MMTLLAAPMRVLGADNPDPNPTPSPTPTPQVFSFSAFGTLGVVHSSESRADFASSTLVPTGAGFTDSWSAAVDSLIGAQLSANITPKLAAVVQVIVQQNYDNSYTPHVEWANIKYQFTPDVSIRIGRAVLPLFLYSDTRNVGYTYPWLRPPVEVYSLLPTTAIQGIDVNSRFHMGDVSNTIEGNFGQNNTPQPHNGGTAYARQSLGFSDTTEYKSFTLRISYQSTHLTITSLDRFLDAFRSFGPQGVAIADQYDSDNKIVATELIGASYDPGHWFLIGEWGHNNAHSFIGDYTGWYLSGGLRVRQFAPYLTYAHESAASNSDPGLPLTGLPPAAAGFAAGLNAGLNTLLESVPDQTTISVGLRWDFITNFDLKLQADHTRLGADSFGTLTNIQPGLRPGGTVNLFSASVDFVF